MHVLFLHQIGASDISRVGGKGANLGEMSRAGFPVPPGFCVTTDAFKLFISSYPDVSSMYARLEGLSAGAVEDARRVGSEVRAALLEMPVPEQVGVSVVEAFRRIGAEHAYAVRSSATAEDLPNASFAGQHDTYLNVRGEDALLDRVRACWVSLFTDRAILYRAEQGFGHRNVELSVVVQRLITPEVSGILFTADPVSGHRNIVSIDAGFGLGEALVSGVVSADLYRFDKKKKVLVEHKVAEKTIALRPSSDGGVVKEELSGSERYGRVLNDADVARLAELGQRIEAHMKTPQDIEWAISGGDLFVLQTRPITSLFPLPEPRPQDDQLHVYFSFSHVQVMTDPIRPMGLSIWKSLFPFGKSGAGKNPYMCSAAGRLYLDITPLLLNPVSRKIYPKGLRIADELSSRIAADLSSREDFSGEREKDGVRLSTIAKYFLPVLLKSQARLWFLPPEAKADSLLAEGYEAVARIQKTLETEPAGAPRLRAALSIVDSLFFNLVWHVPPYLVAGMLAKSVALKLAGEEAKDDVDALVRGLSGNVTTEMDLALGDVADVARKYPAVMRFFEQPLPADAKRALLALEGGDAFLQALGAFLERYGMRGPSEIDISRPRYRDDISALLQMIAGNLHGEQENAHRAHHDRLKAAGNEAVHRLAEQARKRSLGFLRVPLIRRMARVSRNLLAVREHPKFFLICTMGLIRNSILEAARMLKDSGRIDELDDIWYLELEEAISALEHPEEELRSRIRSRRADEERFRGMKPPRILTSDGEAPTATHAGEGLPEGALIGTAASPGTVEGIARVVMSPNRDVLKKGEILVAPFTDPGWTPLFINASGLVMEVGGLMTHGSVVAREYGIPAVVCVPDATVKIRTGQRILVDGNSGFVQILEDACNTAEGAQ